MHILHMIKNQTLENFQKELGSKSPTPGGGVVAALSAQFAASLIEMVCNLTLGKKGYEKVAREAMKIHKDAIEIKRRLEKLAEEDKKAFDKVMEAYKSKSRTKIIKSLKYAIEVPMEIRKLSHELEVLAKKAQKVGNKNAISDAKTAFHLAIASGKSALENIKINKQALAKLG